MKQEQLLKDIQEGYETIARGLVSLAEGKSQKQDILKACESIENSRKQLGNIVGNDATRLALKQLESIF